MKKTLERFSGTMDDFPRFGESVLLLLAYLFIQVVLTVVVIVATELAGVEVSGSDPRVLGLVLIGSIGPITLWLRQRTSTGFLDMLGGVTALTALAAVVGGAGVAVSSGILVQALDFAGDPLGQKAYFEKVLSQVFFAFGTVVVVAPILEEILFRGYILRGFRKNYTNRKALLLSTFLFAAIHMSLYQLVPAFLAGILFGVLAIVTGTIVPSMLAHMTMNFVGFMAARGHLNSRIFLWGDGIVLLVLGLGMIGTCVFLLSLSSEAGSPENGQSADVSIGEDNIGNAF